MRLLRILGSLWTAVAIIGSLALMLGISTLIESRYGTPVAQRWVYRAGWFDVFLGLIALNILCSTLTRRPFKRRHTGFIVTHIGILMVLTGSLLTRLAGVEGQLLLFEGQQRDRIQKSDLEVVLHRRGAGVVSFPLPRQRASAPLDLSRLSAGLGAEMTAYAEHSSEEEIVSEGGASDPENAAVRIRLESQRTGSDVSFWLIERHPSDPHADEHDLGPARVRLVRGLPDPPRVAGQAPSKPELVIRCRSTGDTVRLDLSAPPTEAALGTKGDVIRHIRFMPDARVGADNQLVNASEAYENPAVIFELIAADGTSVPVFRFQRFPEFDSSHGRLSDKAKDLEVEFRLPGTSPESSPRGGPSLFIHTDGVRWQYASRSSRGSSEGEVIKGQRTPTGWMDFAFTAEELLRRARIERKVSRAASGGSPAAEIRITRGKREIWKGWLPEAGSATFTDGKDDYHIGLRRVPLILPFSLKLKDFRKIDYPGSAEPMAYESDVVLEDPSSSTVIHKTISMNKPLDYAGFRIFQSSFVQDAGGGEASVFTVAKNPGIALIYGGSVVLFTGAVLVFFVAPFSSLPTGRIRP